MKIYTRTGDKGTTGLFGGQRVEKDNPRIEAYGTIDELNALLGTIDALLSPALTLPIEINPMLELIQKDLFDIGSHLSTPYVKDAVPTHLPKMRTDAATWMEENIDQMDAHLEPLKNFILPGGGQAGSATHVARTVCRRAERRIISLTQEAYVDPYIVTYVNRQSDFLFALARFLNQVENKTELQWK